MHLNCGLSFIDYDLPDNTVPSLTKYKYMGSLCCLRLVYIPSIKSYFVNEWRVRIFRPFLTCLLIIHSYITFMFSYAKELNLRTFYVVLESIFFLLFMFSYVSAILVGPGYLPFHYPMREESDLDNMYGGIVTNKRQFRYVRARRDSNVVRYFRKARRYVIRPDHYCYFMETFIGKKNMKLFLHFNIWGALYLGTFVINSISSIILTDYSKASYLDITILVVDFILSYFFFIYTLLFILNVISSIISGKNNYERMLEDAYLIDIDRKGGFSELLSVCGPLSRFYLWILPVPAFTDRDEYDLLDDGIIYP